jgi:hypothetical protein
MVAAPGELLIGLEFVACPRTLTLSRAAVALHGLPLAASRGPVLPPEAVPALAAVLTAQGVELTSAIDVRVLPGFQGFHLAR